MLQEEKKNLYADHINCTAVHAPYVMAFDPTFIEVRNLETGALAQLIQGANLRLLFAAETQAPVRDKTEAREGSIFIMSDNAVTLLSPTSKDVRDYPKHIR